jgi:hypothetical protein
LKEENTKLEGMVESLDELIMEIAKEIGVAHMGGDAEAKVEDDDGGGDATAPLVTMAPPAAPAPPVAAAPKEIIEEDDPMEIVPEQEAPVSHEVILANVEHKLLQPYLYRTLMREYEESPSRMTGMIWMTRWKPALTWMSGFLRMEAIIRIELSSLSLKFRINNKSLGIV